MCVSKKTIDVIELHGAKLCKRESVTKNIGSGIWYGSVANIWTKLRTEERLVGSGGRRGFGLRM